MCAAAGLGAAGQDERAEPEMPTDPAEAMQFFEENVEDWDKGPASYLFLPDEKEIWRGLENDDERLGERTAVGQ